MNAPIEIGIDRRANHLVLVWENGERQPLDPAQLRRSCPCAECRRVRLLGGEVVAPPLTQIDVLQPMGYGVQIGFTDGHARGIYPWGYLAQLSAFVDTQQSAGIGDDDERAEVVQQCHGHRTE